MIVVLSASQMACNKKCRFVLASQIFHSECDVMCWPMEWLVMNVMLCASQWNGLCVSFLLASACERFITVFSLFCVLVVSF